MKRLFHYQNKQRLVIFLAATQVFTPAAAGMASRKIIRQLPILLVPQSF
jgi:hypothetical protein